MTEQLRTTLHRIADEAAPLPVADDLWERGRAARRRGQAFAVAAVLALVVSLGGVATLMTTTDREARTASTEEIEGGAIPSRIYTQVPEDLVQDAATKYGERAWSDDVAESDLAIGPASVAFSTPGSFESMPVVIGATDGAYHYLDLPGWLGAGMINDTNGPAGLALSPDGLQLAYAWWDPTAPLDRPMPAGVRVVDLGSGEIRTVPLEGGNGVRVRAITWSPDSRWLAWSGEELGSWTPRSAGSATAVGGRIAPGASTSEPVPIPRSSQVAVAITSSGTVVVGHTGRRVVTWDGTAETHKLGRELTPTSVAAASPDGRSIALGSWRASAHALFVDPETGEETPRELGKNLGRYPEGAFVQPLGWATQDLVLALVNPDDSDEDSAVGDSELVLMTAPFRPADEWTYRVVGSVEGGMAIGEPSLSVAVDLVPDLDGTSSQRLTQDFSPPDWSSPWRQRLPYVLGGLMTLLAGLAYIRMLHKQA